MPDLPDDAAPASDLGPTTDAGPARVTLTLSCPDRPGIVHAVTGALQSARGNIIESQQYGSEVTGRFFLRIEAEVLDGRDAFEDALEPVRESFDMDLQLFDSGRATRTLIMVSKEAHCLNDLLFRHRAGLLPIDIPLIVSNHTELADLADFYGIPFVHVPVTADTKPDAENRLRELIDEYDVELVVLARYMQILSDHLCSELAGRAINIHHSFLPSFKGARPYEQAHQRGVKLIGATAHYVTGDLDEGPIIDQDVVRVEHQHSAAKLVAMGRDVETRTLRQAVTWHAEHRVLLDGHRTIVFR